MAGKNPPAWFSGPARTREKQDNWATMPPANGNKKAPIRLKEKVSPTPPRHQRAGVEGATVPTAWCPRCRKDTPRLKKGGEYLEDQCHRCAFRAQQGED